MERNKVLLTQSKSNQEKKSNSNSGMSLVEVLIAMGILLMLFLGVSSLMQEMTRAKIKENVSAAATMIRQNVYDMLRNEVAWKNTLLENKALNCICNLKCDDESKLPSLDDMVRRLKVLNSAGEVYYDTTQAQSGFNMSGNSCNSFPSDFCPFRMDIIWRMLCKAEGSSVQCPLFPQVEINGKLYYGSMPSSQGSSSPNATKINSTFTNQVSLNPLNYSFTLLKQTDITSGPSVHILLDDLSTLKKWCPANSLLTKLKTPPDVDPDDKSKEPEGKDESQVSQEGLQNTVCKMLKASLENPEMSSAIESQLKANGQGGISETIQKLCGSY